MSISRICPSTDSIVSVDNLAAMAKPPQHANAKNKRPKLSPRPGTIETRVASLDHLEMAGARLAALGDQLVADLLRFLEGRQTSALDAADMDEHVLRAVIRLD